MIEDWGWAHYPGGNPDNWQRNWDAFKDQVTPLSKLIVELVMVVASRPDLISEVNVLPGVVYVTRGGASVTEPRFDIGNFHSTPNRQILRDDASTHWWGRLLSR